VANRYKPAYKEFLHTMSAEDPEVATVTSKGQITIPSRLREEFDIDEGTKLMVVPTAHGLVLKKIDLPSVEEFQSRVEERSGETLSMDEISDLVHEARTSDE
jgi:antitoxin PrlF